MLQGTLFSSSCLHKQVVRVKSGGVATVYSHVPFADQNKQAVS